MKLYLTDEQKMLRETLDKLFATESSPERVRRAEERGVDEVLWAALRRAGVPLLRVAEADGGAAGSLLDAQVVAELVGRHLASAPVLETIVLAPLVLTLGADAGWRARVADGGMLTMAVEDVVPGRAQAVMAASAPVVCVEGDKVYVVEHAGGSRFGGSLGAGGTQRVVLLGSGAVGQATLLAEGEEARRRWDAAVEEWKLLSASALAGMARRSLELAASYALERQAFGRPIGGFQGIAHPLADSVTDAEGAQLFAWRAAWGIARADADAAALVSMAFWWAARAAAAAATRALHTFGGYGVSLEYDIQLYYRRAKAWPLVAGDPRRELLRASARLWGGARASLPDAGEMPLDFSLGAEAEAFAAEVERYLERNLTPELRKHAHHSVAGYHPEFNRQLARDGFLFPHWPKEYGGRDRTPYDVAAMTAVFEAQGWEHVTPPITNQVAQVVMRFATEACRVEVLSRFGSGEAVACMGFTEPSCGCDVFAVKTTARLLPDGDWVIDGSKMFTTAANVASYCFLLVRTNPDRPKHAGLSVFVVPMNTPGIEVQAVHTIQDERTNIVYFSDVRVPGKYLIGRVDDGIDVMATMLELEHAGGDHYRQGYESMVRGAETWAKTAVRDGRPLLDDRDAAGRLIEARIHLEVATVLCRRAIWGIVERIPNRWWGPMAKLFTTESYQRDSVDLMDLAAPESLFPSAHGVGHVELGYRQSIGTTIYGGTSEVQRSLVAEQALGLPKSRN